MVHSIELLFDPDTEAAIRGVWEALDDAPDVVSQTPAGRPHVTLVVAERIGAAADAALRPLTGRLPLRCTVGAPLLLGRSHAILARLIVPTADLLALHVAAHGLSGPHLESAPAPNTLPDQWTPHVTLARRVAGPTLSAAAGVAGTPPALEGAFAALRRWDGDAKVDYLIG